MTDAISESEYRRLRGPESQSDGSYLPHVRDMGLPEPVYPAPGAPRCPRPFQRASRRRTPEYLAQLAAEAAANAADIVECICGRQVKRYPDDTKLNWDGAFDTAGPHLCDGQLDSYRREQRIQATLAPQSATSVTESVTPITPSRQDSRPVLRGVIDVGRAKPKA